MRVLCLFFVGFVVATTNAYQFRPVSVVRPAGFSVVSARDEGRKIVDSGLKVTAALLGPALLSAMMPITAHAAAQNFPNFNEVRADIADIIQERLAKGPTFVRLVRSPLWVLM